MRNITKLIILVFMLCAINLQAKVKNVKIKIMETSDVHGCFLPYDFINQRPMSGSMARVYTYVREVGDKYEDNLLLLENGDILQGQPIAYYYNFIDTTSVNIAARITNFMVYDVQNYGNHDIEPGHAVYDKWSKECNAPMVCANIIDTATGKPYAEPYKVFVKEGVKIVVLGLTTPAIPNWLDEEKWSGLRFENMVESAQKWVGVIKEKERPDVLIGMFHAGKSGGIVTSEYAENASEEVAMKVDGFDAIFFGHDHARYINKVKGPKGKDVWLLNPANNARYVAELELNVSMKGKKIVNIESVGNIVNIENLPINEDFMSFFEEDANKVKAWAERPIGQLDQTLYTRDSFFGSSAFASLIHGIQLELTGADVSFNAPLQFNGIVKEGTLHVADMFNIYKFENLLCTIQMSGQEIKDYLEMSYAIWTNTMTNADDHIMLLSNKGYQSNEKTFFVNPTFNFDSASGIIYEVDVTKPQGEKVNIKNMANGEAFDLNATYKVAMNSYRANNGGELLTRGAKIKKEDIEKRIIWQSPLDLRYYLMKYIEEKKQISPRAEGNWRFVPEEWAQPAIERDRKLIFGK